MRADFLYNPTYPKDIELVDQHDAAPARTQGLKISRTFSKEGVHPFDELEWEKRTAEIKGAKGDTVFRQENVEFPKGWSQLAVDVTSQKYFRGNLDGGTNPSSGGRESSVKQLVSRVADTISGWAEEDGYFDSNENADVYRSELTWVLVNQYSAFNSPVWFNVGLHDKYNWKGSASNWRWDREKGEAVPCEDSYRWPQGSACFILSVQDSMESILSLAFAEGMIFKNGSGAGTDLSTLRSSKERLSAGGRPSGPVSFLKGYDAFAGVIKSGGAVRRSAKMDTLKDWHPDIVEFVECKAAEEEKAKCLIKGGYSSDFNGPAYATVAYQNANLSVRASDAFLKAAESGGTWTTKAVTDGRPIETMPASGLLEKIAKAAWVCGDPGMQYHDAIQDWHTCPNSGEISSSNPCCFSGDTLVRTSEGKLPISLLAQMASRGAKLPMAFAFDFEAGIPVLRQIEHAWKSGETRNLIEVSTDKGIKVRCTPEHRFYLRSGESVEARELKPGMRLRKIGRGKMGRNPRTSIEAKHGTFYQSRWMWEQAYGEIPEGYEVHHKNEDRWDDRLSNFELREATEHRKAHAQGSANARYINCPESLLVEVWEAIEAEILSGGFRKTLGVTPSKWNAYLRSHPELKGKVPFAGSPTIGGRIRGMTWLEFSAWIEDRRTLVNDTVSGVSVVKLDEPVPVYDIEVDGVHNFEVGVHDQKHGIIVHNSEYLHINNSACNLASLNLMKFRRVDGSFDAERYRACCRIMIIAQDALVSRACYPTREIAENSHKFRQLGLGFSNLGALLLSLGVPYDSDAGRGVAAGLMAIMTGEAYLTSARIAESLGAFDAYESNREAMLRVMRKHQDASYLIDTGYNELAMQLKDEAQCVWAKCLALGEEHGYRNAQATVLAPCGTISFLMDCFTGDTLVAVADGRNAVPLKRLAEEGKDVDVYASDGGRLVVKTMRNIRLVRHCRDLVRVAFDDGSSVRCTPEHQFLTRDGRYVRADELVAGESMMRFDSIVADEGGVPRRKIWMGPNSGGNKMKNFGNAWMMQYRLTASRMFPGYTGRNGGLIHHKDHDPLNDRYENLHLCKDVAEHQRIHWADMSPEERTRFAKERISRITPEQRKEAARKAHESQTPEQRKARARKAVEARSSEDRGEWTKVGWSKISPEERTARAKRAWETRRKNKEHNHKVVSVVPCGEEDVYCGEVDDVHNFAIVTSGGENPRTDNLSGVVVHNCETTGIEPTLSQVAYKKLAGGGVLKIASLGVRSAMESLGYPKSTILAALAHVEESGTIEGFPNLRDEHLPVFDCSLPPANGGRSIHWRGHLRMMAACQPFISGAISKSVNCSKDTTWEEIREIYLEGWRLGLKAVAIYRDGSKWSQPLNTSAEDKSAQPSESPKPARERLPDTRKSLTHKFSIQGHEGYLTVGLFPDGRPGELFITMSKEGSTIGGLMDAFATSISMGLQHGVPLKALVSKFEHQRFEPSGFTRNPDIPIAKSLTDYIFRWLGMEFLPGYRDANAPQRQDDPQEAPGKPDAPKAGYKPDGPPCGTCGSLTVRAGSCYLCPNCATTSGCG